MKTKHLLSSITAAVILACMLSCSKDTPRREIRFEAKTFPGTPWTRADYSGETYKESGKVYERINWEKGDDIKIMLQYGEGTPGDNGRVYKIDTIRFSDNRYSRATLEPNNGGYPWGKRERHRFWAAYPSSATLGSTGTGDGLNGTVSWSIPKEQNQKYKTRGGEDNTLCYVPDQKVLLVGGVDANPSTVSDAGVGIDFYPAVNTFDFTVGTYGKITITDFQMETRTAESDAEVTGKTLGLTGDFTVTVNDYNPNRTVRPFTASASGTTGQVITTHFDPSVPLDEETFVNFRVFALPPSGSNPAPISGVTIKFKLDKGEIWQLELKNESHWIEFSPFVKANISGLLIPGAKWKITFDGPLEEEWVQAPYEQEIAVE